jgi:predicted amidophosphoribosyltransferase
LDAALAAVSYEYPWSEWVVSRKFREHTARAQTLAMLMRSAPWVEPALDAADVLIPMPFSTQRLAKRDFNQTLLLANALYRPKVWPGVFLRIKGPPPAELVNKKGAAQQRQKRLCG